METATVTSKGQIVIPAALRRRLKIVKGTQVKFFEDGGEIILVPVTDEYIDAMSGSVKGGRAAMTRFFDERRRERDREDRKLRRRLRRWRQKG